MEKIQCPKCTRKITKCNFKQHYRACDGTYFEGPHKPKDPKFPEYLKNKNGLFECPDCTKEFTTASGLGHHRAVQHLGKKGQRGRKSWNKGLTKDTDSRIKKMGEMVSKTANKIIQEGGKWGNGGGFSEEYLKELSIKQSINNIGKFCKWYTVSGIRLQGTWERDFAIKMSDFDIKWETNRTKDKVWPYQRGNRQSHYCPDFFIPEINIYVEIKGYWWGADKEKMEMIIEQYPDRKIAILTEKAFNLILKLDLREEILQILEQWGRQRLDVI